MGAPALGGCSLSLCDGSVSCPVSASIGAFILLPTLTLSHRPPRAAFLESLIKKSQWACLSVPGRDTSRTNLLAPAEARQHGEVLGMTPLYSGKQKLQPHTRGQAASYLAGADPDCLQAAALASGTTSSTCCLRKYLTGTAEIVAFNRAHHQACHWDHCRFSRCRREQIKVFGL